MIDAAELKTRVLTFTGDSSGTTFTFVAEQDWTLRAVYLTMGWVSADPTKTAPPNSSRTEDLYLNSAVNKSWNFLAFPMPEGTALYWNPTAVIGTQLCTLVMT